MRNLVMTHLRKIIAALALVALASGAAFAVNPYDGTRIIPARLGSTQQTHYERFTVNFNDPSIGTFQQVGKVPQGSFIVNVMVEVVTAFNAATTNNLTVGTASATANEIVAITDLTGGGTSSLGTQVTRVTRGFGRVLTASADTTIYAKYTQTGTAATTGQAIVIVEYVPNNDQ